MAQDKKQMDTTPTFLDVNDQLDAIERETEPSSTDDPISLGKPIHALPVLLSEYGWFGIIGFVVLVAFMFPRYHPAKVFTSLPVRDKWDSSKNPFMFLHATDIHLAQSEYLKIVNTRLLIHTMSFYKANFTLISGDMVDNYGKRHWPKIGRQILDDWNLWRKIVAEEAGSMDFVDLAGNHDMWGLDYPLSDEHHFMDYSYTFNRQNTVNEDEFYAKIMEYRGFKFVLVNPYRFPSAHPPYIYWCHPTRHMLDVIEAAIERAGDCYVVCHYPVDDVWWIRSSKGHTFEEIMQSRNIRAYFSGHWHPKRHLVLHHGHGAVEYIGPGAYQFRGFGVVTIDNGRFGYETIHIDDTPVLFILSHPIPTEDISDHQVFSETETEVRLISYAGKRVRVRCSGSVQGELVFQRTLPNGADLYSLPMNVAPGLHHIDLQGDGCNISRDFFIGKQFKGKAEPYVLCQRGFFVARLSIIPIFLCMLWIVLPISGLYNYGVSNWIEGGSQNSHWLMTVIFGPNIMRQRVQQLPSRMRQLLLFAVVYPLFLPLHFFKPICGMFGFAWLCFIFIGKSMLFDEWALHMTFFYEVVVVMPFLIAMSCWPLHRKTFVFKINYAIAIVLHIGICIINYRWVGESVTVVNLFLNPSFTMMPIALHLTFYYICFKPDARKYSDLSVSELEDGQADLEVELTPKE